MRKKRLVLVLSVLSFLLVSSGFYFSKGSLQEKTIPADKTWSERMALSIMQRNPEPWKLDWRGHLKWEYTQGLVLTSIEEVGHKKKDEKFFQYIEQYANYFVEEDGNIKTYEIDEFNIDNITPGRVLFNVYERTKNEKYKKAIERLRRQLQWQPRTTDGGFWHKLRYPWQMWLDGIYMGSPFYAEYSDRFNDPRSYGDIAKQIILMEKHSRDKSTGLLYHGWDESKVQKWSDPVSGTSPNFWGRAVGWYAMALVDVLDHFPADHPQRKEILQILGRVIESVEKYQDKESGLWYQVLDKGKQEGNYLESSASCMFVYSIAKAVNKGYVPLKHMKTALEGYEGILKNFIEVSETGEVHIHKACAVAGLGGTPYRDGTYDYYINEKTKTNDPKAEGPFILASLQLGR
jgi:unsaturated rhamnogalacturonyl hydrolase